MVDYSHEALSYALLLASMHACFMVKLSMDGTFVHGWGVNR
jgi:hypothetical protein